MAHDKTKMMMIIAMFAALISILAQVTIPLPLIPITGQTLAIGLTATILGSKNGSLAVLVYLLLGLIGLPVFASFSSGFGVLFGPTGGFLIGFIPTAFITGLWLEKTTYTYWNAIIANLIGVCISLSFGVIWLKVAGSLSWHAAFLSGALPFIPVGIIKALLAAWLGILIRQRLTMAKLLPSKVQTI